MGGESHMASLDRLGLRAPHAPGPRCGGLGRAPGTLRSVRGPRVVRSHRGVGSRRSVPRQTQGDVVHQGVQKGQGSGMVDLALSVDRVTEDSFRHDQIDMLLAHDAVTGGFLTHGRAARRQQHDPQDLGLHVAREPKLVSQSLGRTRAITQLDHRQTGQIDLEQVDVACLARPVRSTTTAAGVTPSHVADADVLAVAAAVAVAAITGTLACRLTVERPSEGPRLGAVALLAAGLAVDGVAAGGSGLDAQILPADDMAASQAEMPVVAMRCVGSDQLCPETLRRRDPAPPDAVVAEGLVVTHHVDAHDGLDAAVMAAQHAAVAVGNAGNDIESFRPGQRRPGRIDAHGNDGMALAVDEVGCGQAVVMGHDWAP